MTGPTGSSSVLELTGVNSNPTVSSQTPTGGGVRRTLGISSVPNVSKLAPAVSNKKDEDVAVTHFKVQGDGEDEEGTKKMAAITVRGPADYDFSFMSSETIDQVSDDEEKRLYKVLFTKRDKLAALANRNNAKSEETRKKGKSLFPHGNVERSWDRAPGGVGRLDRSSSITISPFVSSHSMRKESTVPSPVLPDNAVPAGLNKEELLQEIRKYSFAIHKEEEISKSLTTQRRVQWAEFQAANSSKPIQKTKEDRAKNISSKKQQRTKHQLNMEGWGRSMKTNRMTRFASLK